MPFTPFHLGPGAAFKAVGGKHFYQFQRSATRSGRGRLRRGTPPG